MNDVSIAPNFNLIDSHCHLDMPAYSEDLEEVLNRATQNGVSHIITIGINKQSSENAIRLARKFSQLRATIGVHPHDVANLSDKDYTFINELYENNREHVVAYGEIGLDYFKNYADPAIQRKHFNKQLELAKNLRLPIIIHNREADEDTLTALQDNNSCMNGGIMHCFSGDYSFARKVLDLGLLISIPGIVTFKNAPALKEVVKKIPIESIVIETDGPYLSPHPFRGKRNEPAYLLYTAEKISEIKGLSMADVAAITTKNLKSILKIQ